MVPHRVPVVEPDRQIAAPTGASVLPATGSSLPSKSLTTARGVQSPLTSTKPLSASPGKTEARTVPWACWLKPDVLSPTVPQRPAVTKPPSTEKPIEQRAVPPSTAMKYGSAPRTSNSGFGLASLVVTVTVELDTPASRASVFAAPVLPGLATTTSLLVATSTYQPVIPAASERTESSFSLAVTSVCSLRLTRTGSAPALRTAAAASGSVTAIFSVVPSVASH